MKTEDGQGAGKRRGRPPVHGSGAARQAAYRARQDTQQGASEMARMILKNLNIKTVQVLIDQALAKLPAAERAGAIEQLHRHLDRHTAAVRTS